MDENRWDKTERKQLAVLRATKTIFILVVYCLAIALLTACTVTIVVKLIFWPPCTDTGKNCVIDPWSVAGLAGTILGVAATMLTILGALAVAGWWLSLNDRVNDQVNKLYKEQKEEIGKNIRIEILKHLVTKWELDHLQKINAPEPFYAQNTGLFMQELTTLLRLGFIEPVVFHDINSLDGDMNMNQNKTANVKDHFHITDEGKAYLEEVK